MRSTFKVLFYLKKNTNKAPKEGYPVMCRITVNGTQTAFSCKLNVESALWDMKKNCPKKSKSVKGSEVDDYLKNIEAQLRKHYQKVSDRDAYVTAQRVKDAYMGFGEEYKTLLSVFDYHLDSIKARIGKDRKQRTYDRLDGERRCFIRFLKDKYSEDILLNELDISFIQTFYVWLQSAGNCGKTTAFDRTQTLKCLLYVAVENGWIAHHPFLAFKCKPDYKPRGFLSDEEIQKLINVELRYHRQRAVRDMFVFCCFTFVALTIISLTNN